MQGSVVTSLARAFGGLWVLAGFIKLSARCFSLVQPFLLREFLKSISSTAPNARLVSLIWVAMMGFCSLVSTMLSTQCSVRIAKVRISMRNGIKQFLYAKALALSLQSKAKFGMGTLTNLLSNDTPKITSWAIYGHALWSVPFQARA